MNDVQQTPDGQQNQSVLAPNHGEMLEHASAIRADVIAARGYFTAQTKAEVASLGFGRSQQLAPALAIPICGVRGDRAWQLRPDTPRPDPKKPGKVRKYEFAFRSEMHVDVHPFVADRLLDPNVPLFVTEGIKKGDALVSIEVCAVALLSVTGWRKNALPDLNHIAWKARDGTGRIVYIVFDSDVMAKREVHRELRALTEELRRRGASLRYIYLPDGPGGEKIGVDDYLSAGHTLEDLLTFATTEMKLPPLIENSDGLPVVLTNGADRQMHHVTTDAWNALEQANKPMRLGLRDGMVVRAVARPDGLQFERLNFSEMRYELDRAATWVQVTKQGDYAPANPPPRHVVEDVLAMPDKPLPVIQGLAAHPFFGRDGQLVNRDGLDAGSGLYVVIPDSLKDLAIPESPTGENIRSAREFLEAEILADFPLEDSSDRANALAMMFTPFVRPMFDSITPLFVAMAPTRGAGKGLLTDAMYLPSAGKAPARTTWPRKDLDELRKKLFAFLLQGQQFVLIDNVGARIGSDDFESLLTASEFSDRILGVSRVASLPNRLNWALTANSPSVTSDVARRVVPIRLVPDVERPELREGFRHPDLLSWMSRHRREIVTAILTLIQAWIASGARPGDLVFGSYERWAAHLSGILDAIGIRGLMENRDEMLEATDNDEALFREFIFRWADRFGTTPITAKQLFEDVVASMDEHPFRLGDGSDQSKLSRLGFALKKRRKVVVGTFRVTQQDNDPGSKSKLWCLVELGTPLPSPEGWNSAPEGWAENPPATYDNQMNLEPEGTEGTEGWEEPPHRETDDTDARDVSADPDQGWSAENHPDLPYPPDGWARTEVEDERPAPASPARELDRQQPRRSPPGSQPSGATHRLCPCGSGAPAPPNGLCFACNSEAYR